jgi:hypothetical protein
MPNWCYNNLTIRHADPAMLDRVVKAKEALLQEFVPMPQELLEGTGDGWYNWAVSNWGTKWDFSLERVERTDANTVECAFDSAWSPPITAYEKLCVMGFEITAHYYEPGMNFCGTWTGHYEGDAETGDVFTDDEYFELGDYNSDTVRDAVGVELDEMFSISEQMAEWEEERAEFKE